MKRQILCHTVKGAFNEAGHTCLGIREGFLRKSTSKLRLEGSIGTSAKETRERVQRQGREEESFLGESKTLRDSEARPGTASNSLLLECNARGGERRRGVCV